MTPRTKRLRWVAARLAWAALWSGLGWWFGRRYPGAVPRLVAYAGPVWLALAGAVAWQRRRRR